MVRAQVLDIAGPFLSACGEMAVRIEAATAPMAFLAPQQLRTDAVELGLDIAALLARRQPSCIGLKVVLSQGTSLRMRVELLRLPALSSFLGG